MPSLNDIRSTFLNYFRQNDHAIIDAFLNVASLFDDRILNQKRQFFRIRFRQFSCLRRIASRETFLRTR